MSNVQFEDMNVRRMRSSERPQKVSVFGTLLVKAGIVRSQRAANVLLVLVALVAFALAVLIFLGVI